MDTLIPSGFVSKTFSLAAVGSLAPAMATKDASTRPNVKARVFIISRVVQGISVCFLGHDLGLLGRLRGMVNHRVGVFDANAVGASLLFEQSHEGVVVFLIF